MRLGPGVACYWFKSVLMAERLSSRWKRPQWEACLQADPDSGGRGGARHSACMRTLFGEEFCIPRPWRVTPCPWATWQPPLPESFSLTRTPDAQGMDFLPQEPLGRGEGPRGPGRRLTFPQGLRFHPVRRGVTWFPGGKAETALCSRSAVVPSSGSFPGTPAQTFTQSWGNTRVQLPTWTPPSSARPWGFWEGQQCPLGYPALDPLDREGGRKED